MRFAVPGRLPPHPLTRTMAWLLLTFLVLFPKGGIKFGNVPVTWGYLLLAVCGFLALARLLEFPLRVPRRVVCFFAMLLPFLVVYAYGIWANGILNLPEVISEVINFYYFPVLFLLIFPPYLARLDPERFSRHFRFCILAAALFGIAMFFYHPIVGSYIEIPYLTVNAGDYGEIELKKHIVRGTYLKLIATYNNGNLYGIATLILLPLYQRLETRAWKRHALTLALMLTLSRTVWAGLVMNQIVGLGLTLARSLRRFPRFLPGPAVKAGLAVLATAALVLAALQFNGSRLSFLFDPQLGGRSVQLNNFEHTHWIPMNAVGAFGEVIYATALEMFGWSGLLLFILVFLSPLLLFLADRPAFRDPLRRAALRGLMLYPFLALSDGALSLIPVFVFYWFAYLVFLYGWPGTQRPVAVAALHRSPPELSMGTIAAL